MSTFKNISGEDRDVQVDGRRFAVPVGETFDVADQFDDSLADQPFFELVRKPKKDVESATVVSYGGVDPVDERTPDPTPEPAAADDTNEGDI